MTITLSGIIEQRLRNEATKQAEGEAHVLERAVNTALSAMGVTCFSDAYTLIDKARKDRIEKLVHERMLALAGAMLDKPVAPKSSGPLTVTVDTSALEARLSNIATNASLIKSLTDLQASVVSLTEVVRESTNHTKQMADHIDKVTSGGNAMRTEPA